MRALVVLTQPPLPEGGAPGKTAIGLLRGLLRARDRRAGDRRAAAVLGPRRGARRPARRARRRGAARPVGGAAAASARGRSASWPVPSPSASEPPPPTPTSSTSRRPRPPGATRGSTCPRSSTSTTWRGATVICGAPWRKQFREVLDATRAERAADAAAPLPGRQLAARADALRAAAPARRSCIAPLSLDPSLYRPLAARRSADGGTDRHCRLAADRRRDPDAARRRLAARRASARSAARRRRPRHEPSFGLASARSRAPRDFFQGLSLLLFPLGRGKRDEGQGARGDGERRPRGDDPGGRRGDRALRRRRRARRSRARLRRPRPSSCSPTSRPGGSAESAARADFERRYAPGPATEPLGRALPPNGSVSPRERSSLVSAP